MRRLRKGEKTMHDLTGKRFGELTVIKYASTDYNHNRKWLCKCDCGNVKTVCGYKLIAGTVKSCGCMMKKRIPKYTAQDVLMHKIWRGMLYRCENPKCAAYYNYGGRGIKVCDEWHDFTKFENWALNSNYQQGLSLDRINNDGNYESSNCRWATPEIQSNNKRTNVYYDFNGKNLTISQISKITGIAYKDLYFSIKRKGTSLNEAISQAYKRN
jgi:hypothetical protein